MSDVYVFHEREKGLAHVDAWPSITTNSVQVLDKRTKEPVSLCELDPIMFRHAQMRGTALTCECIVIPDRPLFGMLLEANLVPEMFPKDTIPSYSIAPEQVEYLGISEKMLKDIEPLVLIIRDSLEEGSHVAFRDFPIILWEGKAINVKRNTILTGNAGGILC